MAETRAGDSDAAGERAAASDDPQYGYLLGDADAPVDQYRGRMAWSETDHDFGLRPQDVPPAGHFDAFDAETWNFKPAPAPWHRSPLARLAIIAVALAAVALVVSIVLLAIDGSRGDGGDAPGPTTSESPSTTATTAPPSEVLPPPPPPPPPPPESTEPASQEPVYQRPRQPSQSKKPEIGVTRTPVTRSPISVAPQRPSGRN